MKRWPELRCGGKRVAHRSWALITTASNWSNWNSDRLFEMKQSATGHLCRTNGSRPKPKEAASIRCALFHNKIFLHPESFGSWHGSEYSTVYVTFESWNTSCNVIHNPVNDRRSANLLTCLAAICNAPDSRASAARLQRSTMAGVPEPGIIYDSHTQWRRFMDEQPDQKGKEPFIFPLKRWRRCCREKPEFRAQFDEDEINWNFSK